MGQTEHKDLPLDPEAPPTLKRATNTLLKFLIHYQ